MGKMGVPDSILHKAGPHTPEEKEIMKRHTVFAYEMLSPIMFLKNSLDIPYCHHEKWDGTGYPRGLKGEQIPLAARIFAVIDVWDALRSERPYRRAWTDESARAYVRESAGEHFDPKIVEQFFKMHW
jgi:putative two-component system response regulator